MSWTRNYYYRYPNEDRSSHRISTSATELLQAGIAYAVLTVDFVLVFGQVGVDSGFDTSFLAQYLVPLVLTAAAAAFTGFAAHELAHKVAAQRRGFWAEFRVSPVGLLVSVVTAVLGFLWAAPGATVVGGVSEEDREDWGRISLAGPLTNAAFGMVFYVGSAGLFLASSATYFWLLILAFVNAWFGTFNLLPFGPLDGRKVLRWSSGAWVVSFVGMAAFTALVGVALYVYGDPLFV